MKLDHYLDLLRYTPGAFRSSLVLEQTKARNEWPSIYDKLWKNLREKLGETKGTQVLIEILLLSREFGQEQVLAAVKTGLNYGCCDQSSILVLIRQQTISDRPSLLEDVGYLKQYERPIQELAEYNQLLIKGIQL